MTITLSKNKISRRSFYNYLHKKNTFLLVLVMVIGILNSFSIHFFNRIYHFIRASFVFFLGKCNVGAIFAADINLSICLELL